MRLWYEIALTAIGIQLGAYLLWSFNSFGGILQYPIGTAAQMNNLSNLFALNLWTALIGGAGVIIGIAALLLRQGTYALYALLIFAVGIMFNVVQGFVTVIPNTIGALFAQAPAGTFTPISAIIVFIATFAGFMFILEMVLQRPVS